MYTKGRGVYIKNLLKKTTGMNQNNMPLGPFPSYIEPFRPVVELSEDRLVNGDSFHLLQSTKSLKDHQILFEISGREGENYLNSFADMTPIRVRKNYTF